MTATNMCSNFGGKLVKSPLKTKSETITELKQNGPIMMLRVNYTAMAQKLLVEDGSFSFYEWVLIFWVR